MARTDHDPPRRRRRAPGTPIVRRNTVRLPLDVAWRVRIGHPWVYREAIGPRVLREDPGASIDLVDADGEFVGRGLYDSDSTIAVRVFTREPDEPIDAAMVSRRIAAAIATRRRFFDFARYQNLRLVNGEADGLPAIMVDRYGDYLVVQMFSSAVAPLRDAIYAALEKELSPKAIYEQRRFKSLGGEAPRQAGAELVRGNPAPVEIEVKEDDLAFWCDVTAPLSTGLFADLREGRRAVREYAKGRRVLNLFSYTGAISVYAAAGGATEVVSVDVAPKAHARARKNFTASGLDADKPEHLVGDALKVLTRFAERNRRFDMVVIDPPAFASAAARGGKPWSAIKDYAELVEHCLRVTEPGGLLIAASSTHKIGPSEFEAALAEGALAADTQLQVIDRRGLPLDFPTLPAFPESSYLKFVVAIRG